MERVWKILTDAGMFAEKDKGILRVWFKETKGIIICHICIGGYCGYDIKENSVSYFGYPNMLAITAPTFFDGAVIMSFSKYSEMVMKKIRAFRWRLCEILPLSPAYIWKIPMFSSGEKTYVSYNGTDELVYFMNEKYHFSIIGNNYHVRNEISTRAEFLDKFDSIFGIPSGICATDRGKFADIVLLFRQIS